MELSTIIGIIGATLSLTAFILNQQGVWSSESRIYDAANVFGSGLLMVSAVMLGAWHFFILNLVWAGVSLKDVIKSYI